MPAPKRHGVRANMKWMRQNHLHPQQHAMYEDQDCLPMLSESHMATCSATGPFSSWLGHVPADSHLLAQWDQIVRLVWLQSSAFAREMPPCDWFTLTFLTSSPESKEGTYTLAHPKLLEGFSGCGLGKSKGMVCSTPRQISYLLLQLVLSQWLN